MYCTSVINISISILLLSVIGKSSSFGHCFSVLNEICSRQEPQRNRPRSFLKRHYHSDDDQIIIEDKEEQVGAETNFKTRRTEDSYSIAVRMTRDSFLKQVSSASGILFACLMTQPSNPAMAFQPPKINGYSSSSLVTDSNSKVNGQNVVASKTVVYKPLSLEIEEFGVEIPIACWFPYCNNKHDNNNNQFMQTNLQPATYEHRISIRRIGQLLAGWDWIPEFVARDFTMQPTGVLTSGVQILDETNKMTQQEQQQQQPKINVMNGQSISIPEGGDVPRPIILLAHGYLGSRFDLSHLAEELAACGFICFAPEYPESLAASYERYDNLDRKIINNKLLETIEQEWKITASGTKHQSSSSSFGIIGHSLGTGTVLNTGDDTWTRVCIAGYPRNRDGSYVTPNALFISSVNDGAVSLNRFGGKEAFGKANYPLLDEASLVQSLKSSTASSSKNVIPSRAALVYDRPDAPNHISFLSESVNDAMIDLLSPLLPVAQTLGIPVLDFDRYQISRDSAATAAVTHPIIIQYLQQEMNVKPTK